MKDHETLPLVPIKSGKGVWLEDFEGNQYIDAVSSWWVNLFGHANPSINEAIKQQLGQLEHVILSGFTHEPVIQLAEQLVEITPKGLTKCFFADNGSSAVEVALKMSFHYFLNIGQIKKTKFVTLDNAYHGETLGALAVSGVELYKKTYGPLLLEPLRVPSPDCYTRGDDSWEAHSRKMFKHMEATITDNHEEICAVILEPLVQCAGSMRMYHPIYLTLLRQLCDEYNVHLIADEVAVGFGRTGTLFACEQADITPDYLCLSKGITGGYLPLSVVLTTDTIYQGFYDNYASLKAFLHSHSYTGNPLACAAALATLSLFKSDNTIEKNKHLSQLMYNSVAELVDHPNVAEIRQTGMILAIEMVANKSTRQPFAWQERRGRKVFEHGLKNKALLRPLGNVVYMMPPYIITPEEIQHLGKVAIEGIDLAVQNS